MGGTARTPCARNAAVRWPDDSPGLQELTISEGTLYVVPSFETHGTRCAPGAGHEPTDVYMLRARTEAFREVRARTRREVTQAMNANVSKMNALLRRCTGSKNAESQESYHPEDCKRNDLFEYI